MLFDVSCQKDLFISSTQPFLVGFPCVCVKCCDCENPNPKNGIALCSYECPEHNIVPFQNPFCLANKHWFER